MHMAVMTFAVTAAFLSLLLYHFHQISLANARLSAKRKNDFDKFCQMLGYFFFALCANKSGMPI